MAEHEPKFEEYPYLPLINGHIVDTFYGSCDATPKREENINKPAGVNEKKRKTSSGLGDFSVRGRVIKVHLQILISQSVQ